PQGGQRAAPAHPVGRAADPGRGSGAVPALRRRAVRLPAQATDSGAAGAHRRLPGDRRRLDRGGGADSGGAATGAFAGAVRQPVARGRTLILPPGYQREGRGATFVKDFTKAHAQDRRIHRPPALPLPALPRGIRGAGDRDRELRGPRRPGGTTSAQVRKDLSFFGSFGKRGLGYSVQELVQKLRGILGLGRTYRVAMI